MLSNKHKQLLQSCTSHMATALCCHVPLGSRVHDYATFAMQGVRKAVGEALAASPSCLAALIDRAAQQDVSALQVGA